MYFYHAFSKAYAVRNLTLAMVGSVALLGVSLPGGALAEPISEPLASQLAPLLDQSAANSVEPEALDALKTMGAYLASLKSFGLQSDFTAELILENTQSIDVGGSASYVVSRPDRLAVNLVSEFGSRDFIYDGKTLYVVAPTENAFGEVEVGPTIKEMLEAVAYHLGIELPLADLFDWGTGDAPSENIVEGFLVGDVQLRDVAAKHWAFRTADKDFQVWIQDGDRPLLRKIVIEDKTQPGRPAFTADLSWDLGVTPTQASFSYIPPADATKVDFLDLSVLAAEVAK